MSTGTVTYSAGEVIALLENCNINKFLPIHGGNKNEYTGEEFCLAANKQCKFVEGAIAGIQSLCNSTGDKNDNE